MRSGGGETVKPHRVSLAAGLLAMAAVSCCGAGVAFAAEASGAQPATAICIAPVRVDAHYYVAPSQKFVDANTRFMFDFGGYRKVALKVGEALWVRDLPQDQKFLLGIKRDGKPYAAFSIDMRAYQGQNLCLSFGSYGEWNLIEHKSSGYWRAYGCTCP